MGSLTWCARARARVEGSARGSIIGSSNVQRFRGGLVFEAHRILHYSTPGTRDQSPQLARPVPTRTLVQYQLPGGGRHQGLAFEVPGAKGWFTGVPRS